MENYILKRYDKDENGNLIIKIHTKKIEDLYEDYDQKSSFIKKDLKEKDSPKLKKEKVTNSYNITNLKSFTEFLKNDKIKAKIDKNSIKIEFNSQEDIDKISSYFKIQ